MGIMVYSLLWVMQDLYHQAHVTMSAEGGAGGACRTWKISVCGVTAVLRIHEDSHLNPINPKP